jgi:hypothetical protein
MGSTAATVTKVHSTANQVLVDNIPGQTHDNREVHPHFVGVLLAGDAEEAASPGEGNGL